MANGEVKITPESLNTSFAKYRQDLVNIPVYSLSKALPYMTIRPGVRYTETVGELEGDMQLGPWNPTSRDDSDLTIKGRTLETFLGNVTKGFDPASVVKSIYGSEIVQGEALKNIPITKKVAAYLMAKLGSHLYDALFTAKRNEHGTTTKELFNGFCTIADAEVLAGNISAEHGNYLDLKEAVTNVNACDKIEEIYAAADEHLKDEETFILMKPSTKRLYELDYQTQHGSLPYNNEFKKTFVDGDEKCHLVGLSCIPDNKFIMTTKSNLLVGLATSGEKVNFSVEKSLKSHFWLDFVASMFFGTQFESIDKSKILYAEYKPL